MAHVWNKSEYYKNLNQENREKYKKKLTLDYRTTLPDPYSVEGSWSSGLKDLPSITWIDMHTYLIDTPSEYTKEKLKAYKSLDAYNFYVCGHVQEIFHHGVNDEPEYGFLKSKVYS